MQGFAPPAPQGYGPPGPPGGFAPPQGYGPPNAGNGAGRFGTMTPNLGGNRDPLIPLGDHILQVTEIETPVQGDSGTFIYVHFAIVHSSEPNLVGTTCKFSQNWFPNTQGGKQIAFDAVCRLLVPLQGYGNVADPAKDTRNPQVVAQVTGSCGAWVDEFGWNRPGHINGQSLKGAYVRCVARPGQPKPGKTQVYPKYDFLPAQS
jgi:hypothetical protein